MRRIICFCIIAATFFLSGCAKTVEETSAESFSLSFEEQDYYEKIIDETLYSFYWQYDPESLLYFQDVIPSIESIEKASVESGFYINNYIGRQSIVFTVDLIHFDAEKAGIAYFYFVDRKLAGVFFRPENNVNSAVPLNAHNVYYGGEEPLNIETDKENGSFSSFRAGLNDNGFCDESINSRGNKVFATIDNNRVIITEFNGSFRVLKTLYFQDSLVPLSASFSDDGSLAVLLSSIQYNENDHALYSSVKTVFYDNSYNITKTEIIHDNPYYTFVGYDKGELVLVGKNSIEYYIRNDNGDFEIDKKYYISHAVTYMKIDDIDGDENNEYIMTDGNDFYIYRQNEMRFTNVWRTHISVPSYTGNIYIGDINQDGVKEIYSADSTGTAVVYILGERGVVSDNDDITYGQKLYVADYNNDGKDDYILLEDNGTNITKTLYIAD